MRLHSATIGCGMQLGHRFAEDFERQAILRLGLATPLLAGIDLRTGMLKASWIQVDKVIHDLHGLPWSAALRLYPELTVNQVESIKAYRSWKLMIATYDNRIDPLDLMVLRLERIARLL